MLQRKYQQLQNSILSLYAQRLEYRNTKTKVKEAQAYLQLKNSQTSNLKTLIICRRQIAKSQHMDPECHQKFNQIWFKYNAIQQIQMLQKLKQNQNRIGFRLIRQHSHNNKASQLKPIVKRQKRNLRILTDANKYLEQVRQLRIALINERQAHRSCRHKRFEDKGISQNRVNTNLSRDYSIKTIQSEKQVRAITQVLKAFDLDQVYARIQRDKNKKQQHDYLNMKTCTSIPTQMFKSKTGIERNNQRFVILKAHENHQKKLIKKQLTKEESLYQAAAHKCLRYWNDKKREQKMQIKTFKKLRIM